MTKIEMIKAIRDISAKSGNPLGLRQAKDIVDWLESQGEIMISDTPIHIHVEYKESIVKPFVDYILEKVKRRRNQQ